MASTTSNDRVGLREAKAAEASTTAAEAGEVDCGVEAAAGSDANVGAAGSLGGIAGPALSTLHPLAEQASFVDGGDGSRSRSAGEGEEGDRGGMGCRLGFPPTGGVMGVRGVGRARGWPAGPGGLGPVWPGGGFPLLCFIFLFLIYFLFCFNSF